MRSHTGEATREWNDLAAQGLEGAGRGIASSWRNDLAAQGLEGGVRFEKPRGEINVRSHTAME